jgi:hypothetical protein
VAKSKFIENPLFDAGEPLKRCRTCGELKQVDQFRLAMKRENGKKYYNRRNDCSSCQFLKVNEWKKANPSRHARIEQGRHLRNSYGINMAEYERMLQSQHGLCAICNRQETAKSNSGNIKSLTVDHDHASGKIRALLCHSCNVIIGHSQDDPARLRIAAEYLEHHRKS